MADQGPSSARTVLWLLLSAAIGAGLVIAWIDSRPGWDDTGITVALLLGSSGAFGLIAPRRPWLWGAAVGAWIPAWSMINGLSLASLAALAIAFAGSYAGAFVRRAAGVRS